MLDYSLYALLLILSLAAVLLNIVSLPGNWVMLALAAGWSYAHGWKSPAWYFLALMLCILLAAEVVELLASVIGAKKFGASKTASWAAIGGSIVGAILGTFLGIPLIGNLIGAIGGAFLAVWIVELLKKRPLGLATKAAIGAALGRGVGLGAKIGCGIVVWLCLAVFGFPR